MAEAPKNPAPEPEADDVTDGRGPAYPNISLEKAVERVEQLKTAGVARTPLPLAGVLKLWGYKSPSGPARRQVAAVKYYGLLDTAGSGTNRKSQLSDLALKIILDKVPGSKARAAALREAALKPPIFAKLLEQFPFGIGTDAGIETYLTLTCHYSEDAAKTVMGVFRDTLQYAGLDKPDNLPPETGKDGGSHKASEIKKTNTDQKVAVGDLVQVEIEGVLQLEKPARVRAIQEHEGEPWVFIDGSEAGIPMEQVNVEQKGGTTQGGKTPPLLKIEEDAPPRAGTRREVFALDEGDVVLTFPDSLSSTSFEDLDAYLKVFISKMRRRAGEPKKD